MKKTLPLLGVLLIIFAVLLTGCGSKQTAAGLSQDVANKVSDTTVANEPSNPAGTADKSQEDEQKKAANSQQGESRNTKEDTTKKQTVPAGTTPTGQAASKEEGSSSASNKNSGSAQQDSASVASQPVSVPAKAAAQKTVTISINCQTAVNKGLDKEEKFKNIVSANGVILAATTVEIKDGETVFDILKNIVRAKNIQMEYEGSKGTPYIQGINNLYEFDGGPSSGWMYCVNKVYPNYGCGEYKLKAGDVIEWNYTCDLGKDLGQYWIK